MVISVNCTIEVLKEKATKLQNNSENQDLQVSFDLLMLQLADSEFYAYKNITDFDYEQIKNVLWSFRRIASEFLAHMVRKLENELPPNYTSDNG